MISGRSPINRFQRWTQQNFIFISKIGRYPEWDVMRKRAWSQWENTKTDTHGSQLCLYIPIYKNTYATTRFFHFPLDINSKTLISTFYVAARAAFCCIVVCLLGMYIVYMQSPSAEHRVVVNTKLMEILWLYFTIELSYFIEKLLRKAAIKIFILFSCSMLPERIILPILYTIFYTTTTDR